MLARTAYPLPSEDTPSVIVTGEASTSCQSRQLKTEARLSIIWLAATSGVYVSFGYGASNLTTLNPPLWYILWKVVGKTPYHQVFFLFADHPSLV
jgi:hypothetical protein